MSRHPLPTPRAAPEFEVSAWNVERPHDHEWFAPLVDRSVVMGVGESAHFVAEFNDARARLVERLVTSHDVTAAALEIGYDEAPAIQAWLRGDRDERLVDLVGPLTYALYGSFLSELRRRLPDDHSVRVLGVDLPNSLTIAPSLEPLGELVADIDPGAMELLENARRLAQEVTGGSAAASASAWMELDSSTQDALTVALTRLHGRLDAIGSAHESSRNANAWRRARRLAAAATTTDLMLRAMADLFSGVGLVDDTTIRERFVASQILDAVDELDHGERIAYVAHNNHIQKTPVVFDGTLTAYPAGSFLASAVGERYVALALTHRDDEVPEMAHPAETDVGFRVERVAAATIDENSFEGSVPGDTRSQQVTIVRPSAGASNGDAHATMRSQSATAELAAGAFDAALVFDTASTDPVLGELDLLA